MDKKKNNDNYHYRLDTKCSLEENSFILCMKKGQHIPTNDKCKNLFDSWYKCINRDQFIK